MGTLLLLSALGALLCSAAAGEARGARSCAKTRQALASRGFSLASVPPTLISGEHLRICPQDYTCCASETEERLSEQGQADLRALLGEPGAFLTHTLSSRQRRFQDFFQELLAGAERSLQAMFARSYGRLYMQHARLFQGLFVELHRHLKGARPGLDEALSDFWSQLLEQMLPLLNPQYSFPEGYLECVRHQVESLHAFGDSPRQLGVQVSRAFLAARVFVQGLATGRDIVAQAVKLSPTGECQRAYVCLSCPLCRGLPALKPCHGFCLNVMKGCLASITEVDAEWERFLDALIQLAERLTGPFSFELAADSIAVKISEAIMYLQERNIQTSAKVFQSCGNPRPTPARSRRAPQEESRHRFQIYPPEEKPTTAGGTNLDRLVLDLKEKVRLMRRFWTLLPHTLCSSEKAAVGMANEDSCWNGQTRGRYLPDVTDDGLVNQINNPEVEVDISEPELLTRRRVLALRSVTSRLVGACHGQDLDFQDADEDGVSGSRAGYHEDRPASPRSGGGLAGRASGSSRPSPDSRDPPRRERPGKGSSFRQNQSGGGGKAEQRGRASPTHSPLPGPLPALGLPQRPVRRGLSPSTRPPLGGRGRCLSRCPRKSKAGGQVGEAIL